MGHIIIMKYKNNTMNLSLILFFSKHGFLHLGIVYSKSPQEIKDIENEIKDLELEQIYNRRERELDNEDNSRLGDTDDSRASVI